MNKNGGLCHIWDIYIHLLKTSLMSTETRDNYIILQSPRIGCEISEKNEILICDVCEKAGIDVLKMKITPYGLTY